MGFTLDNINGINNFDYKLSIRHELPRAVEIALVTIQVAIEASQSMVFVAFSFDPGPTPRKSFNTRVRDWNPRTEAPPEDLIAFICLVAP